MLDPGEQAPVFELPDQHGELVSLADFRGQRVVLYFYPRAGSQACTTQARGFRDAYEQFEAHEITIFGVSNDTTEALREFAAEYDLPFRLLSDESGDVCRTYDSLNTQLVGDLVVTSAERNTFVIDEEGVIEAVYENVQPAGHAEELLADL